MKRYLALLLAVLMLLSVTACGKKNNGDGTTVTTTTTAVDDVTSDSTTTTTDNETTSVTDGTADTTTTTTEATTTTTYVPDGDRVPIGTKPTTTTTTTAKPTTTTTTTTQVNEPVDGTTTTVTTTTTTTTVTTTTTTKPTEPAGPSIILPKVGSDIDVTKKKNRIRVSDVAAWFNDDGTIGVQLTFKNYSSNWITEETDYVQYTCYDKNGKVVKKATKLHIGVIDTKKHPAKTFEFSVPANTYEVKITKSQIVYWTEWS